MVNPIFLVKGQHGLLAGQNGSGKTQNAIYQLRNTPIFPRFILDTKIEDAFFGLPEGDETIKVVESKEALLELKKLDDDQWADYILIRPSHDEIVSPELLDEYLAILYANFGECFIYIDEMYTFHKGTTAYSGLLSLLTRGRSKGKTVLQTTQRPSWISRFCFTEANKFYIHKLLDLRDRKTFDSMVPNFSDNKTPPKFHFYFFDASGDMEESRLYKPVPFQDVKASQIKNKKKWL